MLIRIDTTSSTPVYAQIAEQIRRAVATGALRPGDALPSLRETAVRLRVNPLTVTRAYKVLEQEGLIETRHGLGSFVAADVAAPAGEYRRSEIRRLIDSLLVDARQLGISTDEVKALLDERIEASRDGRGPFLPEDDSNEQD
jgi:GntR family transcriptional regulator